MNNQNKYSIEKKSMSFKCEKCDKEFSEKMYDRHLLRKTPCISEKKLKDSQI